MLIRTKATIATTAALAATAFLAAALAWAHGEAREAETERRLASEVAIGLTELRTVTFEYGLGDPVRARAQWHLVSDRIDRAIALGIGARAASAEILGGLSEKHARARKAFAELSSSPPASAALAADGVHRHFESQLLTRLHIDQQDSVADTSRLAEIAIARLNAANRRVTTITAVGLAVIALLIAGAAWLFRREVLSPIVRLQHATRQVAAGNWDYHPEERGADEIGHMSRDLEAMVGSLRASFARLEERDRELAELNREIEAFNYSVSHDLRTPLRSMDGFSLVLLEDFGEKLGDEGRDALARIRAASQRMGTLIDHLLRLSRVARAALDIGPVRLDRLAREIAGELARQEPQRRVTWDIEEGMEPRADPTLLRIALQNLLQNAWKFTALKPAAAIRVGSLEGRGGRSYYVSDNGVGFDMAHAGKLFGAFQRLHAAADFPGTGIGLAIVHRIIRRHGGRIWAEAKAGEGATFRFTVGERPGGTIP